MSECRPLIFGRVQKLILSLTYLNAHLPSIFSFLCLYFLMGWNWKAFYKERKILCGVVIMVRNHFLLTSLLLLTSKQKKQCKTEFVCRCAVCWLSWWTSPSTSMWPPGSSSWPTNRIIRITFFRFFIVAYAHDFVKNGQFEIRLFHQIYWLAWMDRAGKIATFFQPERKLPPCTQFQQIFHFQKSVKIILGRVVPTPNLGNEGSFYLESLLLNTTQKYVLK